MPTTDNAADFQACLNSFYTYCNAWKLTINRDKIKIMILERVELLDVAFS